MRFLVAASLVSAFVMIGIGCSATNGGNTFENTGGAGNSTGSSQGGDAGFNPTGGGFNPTGGGGGSGPPACSTEAQYVYVLSDANELYSFDPPNKAIKKIGTLGCNTTMQPNSMAIDRNATAWVNYVESDLFNGDIAGAIYKVSTKDASCDAQPAVTLPAQWYRLGMGFSTDGAGQTAETLFVTGTGTIGLGDSPGLGKIDMQTMSVKPIANFTPSKYTGQSTELTGTGDARLFGYFTTTPVYVSEINKTTGAVTNEKAINGLDTPSAWAFSFWGGSFYLYAASAGNSSVTKYNPADGSVTTYMPDVGFRIVGAGVSTCAPIEEPK